MLTIAVFYAKTATARFDIAYYLNTHTPPRKRLFEPFRMQNLRLLRGTGSLDGSPAPYEGLAFLDMPLLEGLQHALAQHASQVLGEIPNYTDVQPVIQIIETL